MAGEIQLNSTTMATESSGSITAEVDKIRPNTTNGSLILQGDSSDAGVTGLTIDSSGNATFAGTANNLGTVTAGTISGGTLGSSVVFPAGHIITHSTYYSQNASSYYETSNASYTDMGLEINITPKFSSADSFIVVNFCAGLSQNEAANGVACINYSTSSGVTTESSSTQIIASSYGIYIGAVHNTSIQLLHQNYSANTAQYYRIFLKSNSSGNNVRLIHQNAAFSFYAYEVKK